MKADRIPFCKLFVNKCFVNNHTHIRIYIIFTLMPELSVYVGLILIRQLFAALEVCRGFTNCRHPECCDIYCLTVKLKYPCKLKYPSPYYSEFKSNFYSEVITTQLQFSPCLCFYPWQVIRCNLFIYKVIFTVNHCNSCRVFSLCNTFSALGKMVCLQAWYTDLLQSQRVLKLGNIARNEGHMKLLRLQQTSRTVSRVNNVNRLHFDSTLSLQTFRSF